MLEKPWRAWTFGAWMLGIAACDSDSPTDDMDEAATTGGTSTTPTGTGPASTMPPATTGTNPPPDGSGGSENEGGAPGEPTASNSGGSEPNPPTPTGSAGDGGTGGAAQLPTDMPMGGGGSVPNPQGGAGAGGSAGATPGGSSGTPNLGGQGGSAGEPMTPSGEPVVYVGGYDYGSDTYPLRTYSLDASSGELTQRGGDVDAGSNPSYLAVSPDRRHLYAANERDDTLGGLTALTIGADGTLTPLNHQSGSDGGFTYVAVDPTGRFAFGASYNGGSISVFPIEDDGSLGAQIDNMDFGGGAQSHSVGFNGEFVFVPNKGNNEVAQLVLGDDGMLAANTPDSVATAPGAGPRHIAIHPSGEVALVVNELNSTLVAYRIGADGTLTPGDAVSTLPEDFNGGNSGAHVELSPDGSVVYTSNRGHDSIAVFRLDVGTLGLELIEHESTRGSTPRDFEVDPGGSVLIAANQDSGDLAVFRMEAGGELTPLGEPIQGPPSPAAVQVVYVGE